MNVYDILEERGFIYQCTDASGLDDILAREKVTFYAGFDPTAPSLHVGHLLPIMAMRWLQQYGHRAIAVVGGATAMIGDPAGKTEERPIMTRAQVDDNARSIQRQLERFLQLRDEQSGFLLNNADWLADLNYIDFLRSVGPHLSVNKMLAAESVKSRLATGGLSFLEFNYMLLQAYDFAELREKQDCKLQIGGQDQWGNIVTGTELIRRTLNTDAYGITFPLLLKADGGKFGKTAEGTVWLDKAYTSAYQYFQFWRNAADADVYKLLSYFTQLPMDEVKQLSALEPPAINRAKEILAYEATKLAHGEDEAKQAYLTAGKEFGFADPENRISTSSEIASIPTKTSAAGDLPTHEIPASALVQGVPVVKLVKDAGLASSNSEVRRLIKSGGVYINNTRVEDDKRTVDMQDMQNERILLRIGKKRRVQVLPSDKRATE